MRFLLKPLAAQQVSESALDSVRNVIKNVINRSRLILRNYFGKQDDLVHSGYRFQLRLPELTEEIVGGGRLSTFQQQPSRWGYRPGFLHRATSRWASNSLAATIRRNAGRRLFQGSSGPVLAFIGFSMAKKPSLVTEKEELEGLFFEMRDVFATVPYNPLSKNNSLVTQSPSGIYKIAKLEDLKVDNLLAKGCNAAVYSACWRKKSTDIDLVAGEKTQGKIIIPHSDEFVGNTESADIHPDICPQATNIHTSLPTGKLSPYDLALKVMFNYNAESNASAILRAMHKETLPCILDTPFAGVIEHNSKWKKKLPPHPNIVEMYCSFADMVQPLPEAFVSYPQALPVRLQSDGCGRNMTLFLVMKRYHCSLKEYLKEHKPTTRTSILLLAQLLEGLVHLLQHSIAHRDLKTDNILLDLTYGVSNPFLAITDFGCCLESLSLPLQTDEVDRGGNMALMAPEVVMARAGPFTAIDYSRSDLWTAGCLAYEIFGASNPFCPEADSCLSSYTYEEQELPSLPSSTPAAIKKLISQILYRDPRKRPSPTVAATVCQLLLHAPFETFFTSSGDILYKKLAQWMCDMSSQTFCEAVLPNSNAKSLEFQLRYTFCSRVQYSDLVRALQYL